MMKKKPVKNNIKPRVLTRKEELFVREYLVDLNATQAYIRAGFTNKNARQVAWRLLSKDYISEKIQTLHTERLKRLDMDADKVLEEIDKISSSNIKDLFDENNCIKDIKDIPRDLASAIKSIQVDQIWDWEDGEKTQIGEKIKITFWDKPKCLELKGRYYKLFNEKIEIEGLGDLAKALEEGRNRVKGLKKNG